MNNVDKPLLRRRVTIKDIAREIGLSPTTVSLTLGGISKSASIPAETRQRVLDAAQRLDYQPDQNARSLVCQHSFLIGLLTPSINSWIMPDFAAGIQDVCDREGYSIIYYTHRNNKDAELHCRNCISRRVEGVIVSGFSMMEILDNVEPFLGLQLQGIPVVEVFGDLIESAPAVMMDLQASGRMAAEHLLALGHRNILHFTHEQYQVRQDARDLWTGFGDAMAAAALPARVWTSPLTSELPFATPFFAQATASVRAMLTQPNRPTGICCYCEQHALAILWVCREMNIRVPEELSVVGYNDHYSVFSLPPLTTVRPRLHAIGSIATEKIFELLNKKSRPATRSTLVEPELVVRASTAPPRKGR